MNGNFVPILDFGHGGIINGIYQTPGKRSTDMGKGIIYEGVSNRHFGRNIMRKLDLIGVPYYTTDMDERDRPLKSRVYIANAIYKKDSRAYLLSIHSNAGGGTGIEGFTSVGETKSDKLAEEFLKAIEDTFPNERMRFDYFDGDRDKEKDYYILKWTNCPAVLLELWFMDFLADYNKLHDAEIRDKMENCLVEVIEKLYRGY